MNINIQNVNAQTYDSFKALVAQYAPNADVLYFGTSTVLALYAVSKGEPGCKGDFPFAVFTTGNLSTLGITSTAVLTDFPSAIETKTILLIGG
jgi:hypothetical protein